MRKVLGCLVLMLIMAGVASAADNIYQFAGRNYLVTISSETVLTVSSSTVTTFNSTANLVYRGFQNTGTTNINYFYTLASSATANMSYLIGGEKMIDDQYSGAIYFKAPAGTASGTLAYRKFTIR